MKNWRLTREQLLLLLGDTLVLAGVTLAGFAAHNSLDTAGWRFFSTFAPFLAGWLLVAPHLGAYDESKVRVWKQLWRPVWAFALSAPLGALLRAFLLGREVQVTFVLVMAGIGGLALLVWRALYCWLARRAAHG